MADATSLDALSRVVTTTTARIAVTLLAIGLVVGVGVLAGRAQDAIAARLSPLYADVFASVSVTLAAITASAVTVGVWGQTNTVRTALGTVSPSSEFAPQLVLSLVIFLGAYILSRFFHRVINEFLRTSEAVSDHQREITYRITQVTLWVLAAIVVLGLWKVDLGGFLVGAGFLGIVLGMAARQTLGAVLAGFVLMFSRPFEIGDWVEIGETEGIVTDITIVNTRVQTFDGEYVMLPNDAVSGSQIVNRSRKGRLRLEVEVGVDYDTDPDRAADVAEDAMKGLDPVLSVPTPRVVLKRFADSSVVLGLRFWIDKPSARRKWRARTAVVSSVKSSFAEEGITIPFPQRTLSGREGDQPVRLGDSEPREARPTADGGETTGRGDRE